MSSTVERDDVPPSPLGAYRPSPQEKIEEITRGVPVGRIAELATALGVPKDTVIGYLGMPRSTFVRRERNRETLPRGESELALGLQGLIGQVEDMVAGSAAEKAAGFDASGWLAVWLKQPLPALGGRTPASYLDVVEGQKLIGGC